MGKKAVLDKKGYYRLLKVSPGAPPDEIRLSYAMARQNAEGPYLKKLEQAYETLKDPARKAAYDAEGRRKIEILKSPYTLAACVAVLVLVVFVVYAPAMSLRRKSFATGQTLVEIATGREFGVVVRSEPSHAFPGGVTAPAYLIRLPGSSQERWYPAVDIRATCDPR